MKNIDKEFWKQIAGSMVRKLMMIVATWLLTHGWISGEQSNTLSSIEIVEYAVAFLLFAAPLLWSWAKVNFNVAVVREARRSEPDTPIGVITTNTLEKKSVISSV